MDISLPRAWNVLALLTIEDSCEAYSSSRNDFSGTVLINNTADEKSSPWSQSEYFSWMEITRASMVLITVRTRSASTGAKKAWTTKIANYNLNMMNTYSKSDKQSRCAETNPYPQSWGKSAMVRNMSDCSAIYGWPRLKPESQAKWVKQNWDRGTFLVPGFKGGFLFRLTLELY